MNSFSKHNRDFYDKTSKQWLDQLAAIKGIYHHEDLVAIQPELVQLIARSTEVSILEIGSGYGRVAEWFVQNFPLIRYCGFDFSQVSIDYCQRRFSDFSNMQFTVSDITDRQRSAQALAEHDLVLWPWGGLLEVSNLEKRRALTNIFHLTKPGGQLLIELPKDLGTGEPLRFRNNNIIEQHSHFGFALNQIMAADEIETLSRHVGFIFQKKIEYATARHFKRYFLLLRKEI